MDYDVIVYVLVTGMAGRETWGTTEAVQGQVLHPPLLSLSIWHIQSYCRAVCGDERQNKGFKTRHVERPGPHDTLTLSNHTDLS